MFFFKQKTAYEMRISDWSSDVCSSDLILARRIDQRAHQVQQQRLSARRAEAIDQLAGLQHVDERMAKVLVVSQRRLGERLLDLAESAALEEGAARQAQGTRLVFGLDRGNQGGGVKIGRAHV